MLHAPQCWHACARPHQHAQGASHFCPNSAQQQMCLSALYAKELESHCAGCLLSTSVVLCLRMSHPSARRWTLVTPCMQHKGEPLPVIAVGFSWLQLAFVQAAYEKAFEVHTIWLAKPVASGKTRLEVSCGVSTPTFTCLTCPCHVSGCRLKGTSMQEC